jgi:hypothetical protein
MERTDRQIRRVAEGSYWSEADARVVVDAWRRSGETQLAFAARYGIDPKRVGRWATRLTAPQPDGYQQRRSRRSDARTPVRFHRARVVTASPIASAESPPAIEVILRDGRSIRVPRGFAAEDLHQVLVVLEAAARC